MKNVWKRFSILSWGLMSATFVLQPNLAQAQIQRSFLNPSFESPVVTTTPGQQCYVQVLPSVVPGWETTHGSVKTGTGSCNGYVSPGNTPLIEIWTTGFSSNGGQVFTATGAGNQFAELNAEQASELYQNLCLINGETISFSLLHRGRSSATKEDVASFLIGTDTTQSKAFGIFSTTSNGTVTIQPVAQNGAIIPNVTNNNAGNGWVRYTGTVPYTGTTGNQPVGFYAISTAGGNNTIGNFLDDVQFAGKPIIELAAANSGSGSEAETTPTISPPKIRVVGLVPTGGITVPITVTGGTATQGADYIPQSPNTNFNVFVPAGNYDGINNSTFNIPFTVINDNLAEGDEIIIFKIGTPTATDNYLLGSTQTCGGTSIAQTTYTINDNDFISGTVWDDANNSANNTFTNIYTSPEVGTNAGSLLNAILVKNNLVIATTPISADGTYSFTSVANNQTGLTIILSTTAGITGTAPPTPSLPTNWVNTSPLTSDPFAIVTSHIPGKDFGIEQLPNTDNKTATAQVNPGGTYTLQVPTLSGTDPEDGNIGIGNKFKIVTLPQSTGGILYYNGIAVTVGQVITSYDPSKLTVDPSDTAVIISFKYAAIDAANQADPTPATATIPLFSAKFLLVKRITSINNTSITDIVDGRSDVAPTSANYVAAPRDVDDNDPKWPNGYLKGLINAGNAKPGDELEYTIYFLSSGPGNANNVKFCDLVPSNVTFIPTAFSGLTPSDGGLTTSDQGIALAVGSDTPNYYLSNIADTDRGTYYPANDTNTPALCGNNANTNGAVVVNITNATLTSLPSNLYGFVRFHGKVK